MEVIFLIITFQWIPIHCQLNLYNTDRVMNNQRLDFDCLFYRIQTEQLVYQDLSNVIDEIIPYCFRSKISDIDSFNPNEQMFTFQQLFLQNITIEQLIVWSAPIDLIEEYQFYLNNRTSSLSKRLFCNCTRPWFGSHCEYSFEFSEDMSINNVIEKEFSRKNSYIDSRELSLKLPCYIHIPCDRGGSNLCLDWREICDGRIDCLDGGLDEAFCFEMELNECSESEYRCHNGLCISEEFWENGFGAAECLDRSDEMPDVSYPRKCFQDPRFHCEEHSCRKNWHEFSCGDGECVQKFDQCQNGRHLQLIDSMIEQGDLTEQCWMAMICLTKLRDEIRGLACQSWLNEDLSFDSLQTCPSIVQFPSRPIHHGHLRFLYEKSHLKINQSSFLLPDYICYDEQLCDCLIPTYFHENFTCVHTNQFEFQLGITDHPWVDLVLELDSYFSSCKTRYSSSDEQRIVYENISSIYFCQNSSKFISKHRFSDQNQDCCLNEDENASLSCLLNDKYRISCPNSNLCLSSLHAIEDCPDFPNHYLDRIPFHIFCNGLQEHLFEDSNGQIYTDESECQYWPCANLYSQCDGYWSCSNGEDEYHCSSNEGCPLGTHPCVSKGNDSLSCLTANRINDGTADCLGASDEVNFCRELYSTKPDYERFRCLNSDLCLSVNDLCDGSPSCPEGDDEYFCQSHRFICEDRTRENSSLIEKVLCQLSEYQRKRLIHFSLRSSVIYPQSTSEMIEPILHPSKPPIQTIESRKSHFSSSPWQCYRGLTVRIRSSPDTYQYGCMCPPSYYGHLCQYQNQRISLTLALNRPEKDQIYTIVIVLIDENDQRREIDSYEQIDYRPNQKCGMKFNRYLLYSTRPKNLSKNYTIRIDVYEKRTMSYRGTWHHPIPFFFLPVNRIAIQLTIPAHRNSTSSECSIGCQNGECVQYLNKAHSFCRCFPGWSGVECAVRLDCQSCSSDSICVGSMNNRSICVCPLTKFGPRCLLTSSCRLNACENNGQCIPADLSIPGSEYACLCSEEFFGSRCQYPKAKVEIVFEDLDIPSYVMAFFLTISEESDPTSTILLQKLTLFQRIITFRISIPYHLVILKSNEKFYLAVVQQTPRTNLFTSINPNRECPSIASIFNSSLMKLPRFQRIKYYHLSCQNNLQLNCFYDETYFCLCTANHQTNCFHFERDQNLHCSSSHPCANHAQCLQDHPHCPSSIICVCQECFFGDQCQFYAKGFGLTLDEILGYEIKPNVLLSEQTFAVKLSAILTMIMFVIGLLNGGFSILTFNHPTAQEVGCGLYLLASSVTSLMIVIFFTLKFWILLFSSNESFAQNFLRYVNCMLIEPSLKIFLYTDNWFNACIAVERAIAVFKGIYFNKQLSKYAAKWVIPLLVFINILLLIPQLSSLHLFNDEKEKRTWCVVHYSSILYLYNSFLLFFHFFTPFLINVFSAICIIVVTARQRAATQTSQLYFKQFKNKLNQHKHLLISPILLILLSLPRLIISFTLDCEKSSKLFWLYLLGYFVSFMPSVLVFVVFVLPSAVFKKSFKQAILRGRRRLSLFKIMIYSK